jgi:putative phosphoribosyl transferase
MAMGVLHHVKAAVLLIVGSLDYDVIQLNEKAYAQLICEKDLKVINGASHLFEEPGTLDKVADEAINWFKKYLVHIEEKV